MKYWIQKHDYSADDFDVNTVEEIIEAFKCFDWSNEIRSLADETDKNCPPGLGINSQDQLLHICPVDEEFVFFNYHYKENGKILGLFNTIKNRTHYVAKYPIKEISSLLTLYAVSNQSAILAIS